MKQKDIAWVVLAAGVAGIISFLVSGHIFAPPSNRQQPVEVVQAITADFPQPDKRYFNSQSFDPTRNITISQNANPNPFSGSTR